MAGFSTCSGTYLATLGTLLFVSVGFTQTHLGEVDFTPFGNALNPRAERGVRCHAVASIRLDHEEKLSENDQKGT
jgi:hypothetical protein